jgi:type IV secretion system protein VirB11
MDESHAAKRGQAMLLSALGPVIAHALVDRDVVEIMINPDGWLWTERASRGRERGSLRFASAQVERIIRLVASHAGKDVGRDGPIVSADLALGEVGRERFEGLLPPLVEGPCLVLRKHRQSAVSLASYLAAGMLDHTQMALLIEAVAERRNILIAGGTGSGKTTLANALLGEIAKQGDRLVLIEDTRELHCAAQDHVALRTRDDVVTMRDLVRSSLRLRPDRIIVGEVRGGEALDLLKAWNTGHPGGIATIHANDVAGALVRLEQLALEATHHVAREMIAQAVHLVILITGRGSARQIAGLAEVVGVDAAGRFQLVQHPCSPPPSGDRHA